MICRVLEPLERGSGDETEGVFPGDTPDEVRGGLRPDPGRDVEPGGSGGDLGHLGADISALTGSLRGRQALQSPAGQGIRTPGGGRDRHTRMDRLVQQLALARTHRQHPAHPQIRDQRLRTDNFPDTGGGAMRHGRMTQITKPPANHGRFKLLGARDIEGSAVWKRVLAAIDTLSAEKRPDGASLQ